MKKILAIFLTLTLTSVSSIAQENLSARDILDHTSARMQKQGGISAEFTTTIFHGTQPHESIKGTIDILGDKYVMKTSEMSTWFNGKDQWNMITQNQEVTCYTPTTEELVTSSPTAFLGIYKKGFKLSAQKTELRGRKTWDISLKPKKRGQEPSVIIISVDRETYDPMCIRVRNQGDWTRISINGFSAGAGLTDKHFDYPSQDYPEYEVIDMR